MSVILQPQQDFPIVRQIANHLDIATYYVQAIVRDADGVTLDTVNLTDQGGQRFQRRWRVPVDRSGQGAYISIVTSVYTDAGYTTKSNNYGDEENTYLIFDRVTPAMRGGGGPGIGDIRRVIKEELAKIKEGEEPIEIPDYSKRLDSIQLVLSDAQKAIAKIPTSQEKTDLTHVLVGIQNLADAIDKKAVTPATDLEPVLKQVADISQRIEARIDEKMEAVEEAYELTQTALEQAIKESVTETVKSAKYVNEIVIQPHKEIEVEKKKEEKKPFNIKKLAV